MTAYAVNPLFLFLAVWATAVGLYAGGVYAGTFPVPGSALWPAVLLSVGGFSLGYLTWAAFRRLLPPAELTSLGAKTLSTERIPRLLQLTGLMGLLALTVAVYRTSVIAAHFGMSLRDLLTAPGMLRVGVVMFVSTGMFETSWIVMLSSVANALFSIGFVLLGVFLHVDVSRRKYFYAAGFLLITLASGLASVSRYETTVNIVYMVFAYCLVRSLDRRPARGRGVLTLLLPLGAGAVLFFTIDLLLQKSADYYQPTHLQGFLYHLFWYMASPLAAFNEFLTTFDGRYHLGQYTFFPLYKWLVRLHLAPQENISAFIGEYVFVPYVANTYTWLRNFYEDFGLIGVTTVPYLLGLAICALRPRAGRSLPYLNLYLILLVFILFSFFNYFLISTQAYLQIALGFLFFRHTLPVGDGSTHSA